MCRSSAHGDVFEDFCIVYQMFRQQAAFRLLECLELDPA